MKKWITSVRETLEACLGPVSHEINELDWKQSLSPKKERLMQHLSAFANHPSGGVLVFGIDNQTTMPNDIQQDEAAVIVGQIANLGRDALEPPVAIDHRHL
ncbi:MAG: ATP-binding protein [Candidatus Brocadiaceae bacterium]|nr:ATP-binding protein [Candidatus Brocadiaceae bacterium]